MSSFIDSMFDLASKDVKTIVLPEGNDPRTLEAAEKILEKGFAQLVILGDEAEINASGKKLEGARIVDVATSPDKQRYADAFFELRKHKGVTEEDALATMDKVLYFGTMMVKLGEADGMVAGACHSTSDVLRAALQVLKTAPGVKNVSSFFLMVLPDGEKSEYGENGMLLFSDCGLNVQPSAEVLAEEAIASAKSWKTFTGTEARIAMLSHSSFGSAAANDDRDKVQEAVRIAKEEAPELMVDGEMQLDTALVPSVAASKAPDSSVAGKANVLIFPDLDAGNIGYKLVQRLAGAEAYGPVTQGIAAPVNDLSRGCSADDIVGVVAITCVQAQNN